VAGKIQYLGTGRRKTSVARVRLVPGETGVTINGKEMREAICADLDNLGITIDHDKNNVRGKETVISKDGAKVAVLLIPTNEELMIAKDTVSIVKAAK